MRCPPFGLCVPVELVRVRDPDTIEFRVKGTALVWAVRLKDVWNPDDNKELVKQGKDWLIKILPTLPDLRLYLELPKMPQVLQSLTFDRLVGVIFVGDGVHTLNEIIIAQGYASSTKGGPLGR